MSKVLDDLKEEYNYLRKIFNSYERHEEYQAGECRKRMESLAQTIEHIGNLELCLQGKQDPAPGSHLKDEGYQSVNIFTTDEGVVSLHNYNYPGSGQFSQQQNPRHKNSIFIYYKTDPSTTLKKSEFIEAFSRAVKNQSPDQDLCDCLVNELFKGKAV